MTDLRRRFARLDELAVPDLWGEIEHRAGMATLGRVAPVRTSTGRTSGRQVALLLAAAALLLALAAALVGAGSRAWRPPTADTWPGLSRIPVAPGIPTHSIIAVDGDGPPEDGTDGVVAYRSAHIEGVESELIVRSAHSCQANPNTVAEVRRILLLHAETSCSAQGIGCGGPMAQSGPLLVRMTQ